MFHPSVFFLCLIVIWSVKPFLKKMGSDNLTAFEFLVLHTFFFTTIIASVWIIKPELVDVSKFKNLTHKELYGTVILAIISVSSSFMFQKLIKKFDVSYLLPHIQPTVLVIAMILGYFYGEIISLQKIIGTGTIVAGLLVINWK